MASIQHLLTTVAAERPTDMLNDDLVSSLTWGDLEREWEAIASPENLHLVKDATTAIWKQSGFLPERHTLGLILAATVLLARPTCLLQSGEG